MITHDEALKKLQSIGEEHLLGHWSSLDSNQQQRLLSGIDALKANLFLQQKMALQQHKAHTQNQIMSGYSLFEECSHAGSSADRELGMNLLKNGKVGCLLVAGGQGSRLSFEGPKGTFPVSPIKNKSLFQLFAERTLAAGKQVNRLLSLAIMTSAQNHEATIKFFHENLNFGLSQDQLFFFQQEELPFLSDDGHLMPNELLIAKGPNGNGSALTHFVVNGIWDLWQHQGIDYVNFILVDNPLADPFDAELIGFHARNSCDITVKCIEKEAPDEHVGVLVQTPNGVRIIEYSEMSDHDRIARKADGSLSYNCANISLFCFSMSFIKMAVSTAPLPWHLAYKSICRDGPKGWKFETFIFDFMNTARVVKVLLYPRAHCFAPLKNASGDNSLKTVREALINYDREVLSTLSNRPISSCKIELDPQFYYPTDKLLQKWRVKDTLTLNGYIEP